MLLGSLLKCWLNILKEKVKFIHFTKIVNNLRSEHADELMICPLFSNLIYICHQSTKGKKGAYNRVMTCHKQILLKICLILLKTVKITQSLVITILAWHMGEGNIGRFFCVFMVKCTPSTCHFKIPTFALYVKIAKCFNWNHKYFISGTWNFKTSSEK